MLVILVVSSSSRSGRDGFERSMIVVQGKKGGRVRVSRNVQKKNFSMGVQI